jgi:hypothetical protein
MACRLAINMIRTKAFSEICLGLRLVADHPEWVLTRLAVRWGLKADLDCERSRRDPAPSHA